MTDRNKFEEMLERLINEDRDGAEELFHEIVVEKSREIYQRMIESEEEEVDEAEEDDEDELDESADEDEDDLDESEDDDIDEMFGLDEFAPGKGGIGGGMDDMDGGMGGDATDDMMGDIGGDTDAMGGMDGMDDMDGSKPATKADLDDVIDQLKAEFEKMLNGDNDDDEEDDMGDMAGMDDMDDMDGMDDMDDEEDSDDEDDEDDEDSDSVPSKESFTYEARKAKSLAKKDEKKPVKKTAGEQMREYVEKVSPAKMGDNGTNAKSIVANKNNMGGTTANILRTDTENSGEANKGHLKGSSLFKGTPKENNAGNVNVPGGKAGKTAFKKSEPGHGAERRGKPETADKGAHSTIRTTVRSK